MAQSRAARLAAFCSIVEWGRGAEIRRAAFYLETLRLETFLRPNPFRLGFQRLKVSA